MPLILMALMLFGGLLIIHQEECCPTEINQETKVKTEANYLFIKTTENEPTKKLDWECRDHLIKDYSMVCCFNSRQAYIKHLFQQED